MIKIIFALSSFLIFNISVYSQPGKLLTSYAKGEFNKENFYPCIAEMTKLITANPKNDAAYLERARCMFFSADDSKDYDRIKIEKAIIILDEEKVIEASNSEWDKRRQKAMEDATMAIQLNPRNAAAYNLRGFITSKKVTVDNDTVAKFSAAAIADFTKALKIDPTFVKSYLNRGLEYYKIADYIKATIDFKKVLSIDPNNEIATKMLPVVVARAETEKQERDRCMKSAYPYMCVPLLKAYAAANPNSAKAFLELARANNSVEPYYSVENRESYWQNAEAAYLKVIELAPKELPAYTELVALYLKKLNDNNKAFTISKAAVNAMPGNADAYVLRGENFLIPGDTKNALLDFNKAIELNPKNSAAFVGRGDVYDLMNDYTQSLTSFNKAIELNASNGKAYLHRGFSFAAQKKYEEAIKDFTTADNLKITCAKSYRGNAYTMLALSNNETRDRGNFTKARNDFLSEESGACYLSNYFYAQSLYAQGFYKEALERFEYALKRFKASSEASFTEILTAKKIIAELKGQNNVTTTNQQNQTTTITQILESYKRSLPSEGLQLVASGVYDYSVSFDSKMRFSVERIGFGKAETYVIVGVKEDKSSFGFDVMYDDRFIAKITDNDLGKDAQYGYTTDLRKEGGYSVTVTNFYLPRTTNIRNFQFSPRGSTTSTIHWLIFKK